jgi:microsomal dipeptidase-like Zn-dependent dipeptidase
VIGYINFNMSAKYFSMQRKALSIRDILSIIDFVRRNITTNKLLSQPLAVAEAFKHAVELVIIDGVCLGIDVTESEQVCIVNDCTEYLNSLVSTLFTPLGQTNVD